MRNAPSPCVFRMPELAARTRRYTVARTGDRETKVTTCRQIASRPRTRRQGSNTPTTASTPTPRSRRSRRCPFRFTAGRATMSAGSRLRGVARRRASRRPGTTLDARARPTSCGATRPRRCHSYRARIDSICTRFTGTSAAGASTATRLDRSTSPAWIDWAKSLGIGLDFNPTFFSHPKAADNFTLCPPGRRSPAVLDPSRHRVPPRRRRDGRGARQTLRDEPLDPGWHEGHAGGSPASRASA